MTTIARPSKTQGRGEAEMCRSIFSRENTGLENSRAQKIKTLAGVLLLSLNIMITSVGR